MAELAVLAPSLQLHLHKNLVQREFFFSAYAQTRSSRRVLSKSLNSSKYAYSYRNVAVHRQDIATKCNCLGALVNAADEVAIAEWVPYVDQVLLMASIFLTYIAGVIPSGRPLTDVYNNTTLSDATVSESSSVLGSDTEDDDDDNIQFAWDIVKIKLLDSLNAMQQAVNDGRSVSGIDEDVALRRSSLFALAELPRTRCMWATFEWLRKEVDSITGNPDTDFSVLFARIVQNSSKDLCLAWLEEELSLKDDQPKKALLSLMIDKLNGYDKILKYITKSGKEDLYAELIGALRFGSAGLSDYYDPTLFIQNGVSILEDLVITLADGIASIYLELMSVDSSMTTEMNSIGANLCTLSTRALQKLRNEVALHQWLHQNMESVVSMYEDRFELRTLQTQFVQGSSKREAESFGWWKKLSFTRSRVMNPSLSFVVISKKSISVKRTKELRSLTGWPYYFSLVLEVSDIAMPLIRTFIRKVSDAISFFLVSLIGRSLGLIYTGIRQSLKWK